MSEHQPTISQKNTEFYRKYSGENNEPDWGKIATSLFTRKELIEYNQNIVEASYLDDVVDLQGETLRRFCSSPEALEAAEYLVGKAQNRSENKINIGFGGQP